MSFSELFPIEYESRKIDRLSPEPLVHLPYDGELKLKNAALGKLLKQGAIPVTAEPVCASPYPRHYRCTGKRRVTMRGNRVFLHFGRTPGKEEVVVSALEPENHGHIYQHLHRLLSNPKNRAAAQVMNYCILRGSYTENILIFNVKKLSGEIVRCLKYISEAIRTENPCIRSIFLYVDEKGSDYYLEAERPEKTVSFKKLYGPDLVAIRLDGRKYLYAPTSFSQINESILPDFLEVLKRELSPSTETTLQDLYCGYGIWSLAVGEHFKKVWGAELSPDSIKAARNNAKFHFPGGDFNYESGFINESYLRNRMPQPQGSNERILLDPPRNGCAPGVLEYLISRRPERILHLFCGADEIVPALKVYLANGCKIEKILPFDFFPGTMNLEVLAVIRKKPADKPERSRNRHR